MQNCKFNKFIVISILMGLGVFPSYGYGVEKDRDSSYEELIQSQTTEYNSKKSIEYIASGTAAAMVGIYGYYFDDRGTTAKIVYGATQTAGILVIGSGIKKYYSRSLILDVDHATQQKSLSPAELRQIILSNSLQAKHAQQRSDAWTAGLLGGLYLYNAYRTPVSQASIRNIYLFLSLNALAVSGYNIYQISQSHDTNLVALEVSYQGLGIKLNF